MDRSLFSGNLAGAGGGIENASSGMLTVLNSTLSDNSATFGGGISNRDSATLTVISSTLSGNSASTNGGGGISNTSSVPSLLANTIVAANFGKDITGAINSSSSHNLIGVDTNLSGIINGSNGNLIGTAAMPINPLLGALQANGGPTATMALLPGSPAINAGDNSLIPVGVTTDQRGTGYARIDNGIVDIGAYELASVNHPPLTFIVTNLDDNGPGSLRQAILDANSAAGADIIADIIQFDSGLTGTILLTSGELDITDDSVDIQGPGASVVTVSGSNLSRVFYVTANATISGLTISGGNSSKGGGIYNAYGTLAVDNAILSGNSASGNGGGIYNAYGALTVDNSTLSGNSASGGGGIYSANYGTSTVVRNSNLSSNSASTERRRRWHQQRGDADLAK